MVNCTSMTKGKSKWSNLLADVRAVNRRKWKLGNGGCWLLFSRRVMTVGVAQLFLEVAAIDLLSSSIPRCLEYSFCSTTTALCSSHSFSSRLRFDFIALAIALKWIFEQGRHFRNARSESEIDSGIDIEKVPSRTALEI